MAGKSIWPPPVYVATFSDGTECRMSIWSRQGKPLDFERGRKVCCSAIGGERAWKKDAASTKRERWEARQPDNPALRFPPPATDIVAGHFDQDGEITPDPFFMPEAAAPVRKRVSAFDKLLASLDKLSHDDLARLSVVVDGRLLTAE